MRHSAVLLVPSVLLIFLISGCTIPGTDIEIPWIPDFLGGNTINYNNDIIIIKEMQITPGTTVKSGQTITLYVTIQNLQDPEKVYKRNRPEVTLDLYDHCSTLFEVVSPKTDDASITGIKMDPQEIYTASWTLKTKTGIKLITPCELKVKASYSYDTDTTTTLTFIDAGELNSRIRRGEAWQTAGSTSRGYGPVKVFLEVIDQQPVPTDTDAQISVQIKNVGQGFVKNSYIAYSGGFNANYEETEGGEGFKFDPDPPEGLKFKSQRCDGNNCFSESGCAFDPTDIKISQPDSDTKITVKGIKLVNKKSTPKFCTIEKPTDVEVEKTYVMNANVAYNYEFRKSINVRIEPMSTV